jgi:hypothetical protein
VARNGQYGVMSRIRIPLGIGLLLVGLLAGCATPTGTPSGSPNGPAGSSTAATLPGLSLTRTGGFAGVNQTLTVTANGSWTYTDKKTNATETGQFTPAQLGQLAQLAADPRLTSEALQSSNRTCTDAFQYTITVGTMNATVQDCAEDRPAARALLGFLIDNTAL